MSNDEYEIGEGEPGAGSPPPVAPPPIPEPRFVPSRAVGRPPKSKGHGCLIGCLIAAAVMLVIIVLASVGLYNLAMQARDTFTDTTPIDLPVVEADAATIEALSQRVATFGEALDKGFPAAPLVLSEKDINILIQEHPDWVFLEDMVHVTITDDKIGGIVSISLDVFELPFLEGRYLNGSVEFSVSVNDGILYVYLRSFGIKERRFTENILSSLRAKNLAEDMQDDPDVRAMLEAIENVEVKDDMLIIVPKTTEDEGSTYVRET